jgi:hypothetical protein
MKRCGYSFSSSSSSSWLLICNNNKKLTYMQILEQVILYGACRGKKTEVTWAWNFPEYEPSLE